MQSTTSATTFKLPAKAGEAKQSVIWTYVLFWYLTGATPLLIGLSRTASFEGFKDATITSLLWLIPLLLLPQHAKKTNGIVCGTGLASGFTRIWLFSSVSTRDYTKPDFYYF